jgi:type I restriction enzyme M protein
LDESKLGCSPIEPLTTDELYKNNLPDVLVRWAARNTSERARVRTDQSFCISKAEIVAEDYDLSPNRYKELAYEEVEHRSPLEIIGELERLEDEIRSELDELKGLVI